MCPSGDPSVKLYDPDKCTLIRELRGDVMKKEPLCVAEVRRAPASRASLPSHMHARECAAGL